MNTSLRFAPLAQKFQTPLETTFQVGFDVHPLPQSFAAISPPPFPSMADLLTVASTPAACSPPMTAVLALGQRKRKRGSYPLRGKGRAKRDWKWVGLVDEASKGLDYILVIVAVSIFDHSHLPLIP